MHSQKKIAFPRRMSMGAEEHDHGPVVRDYLELPAARPGGALASGSEDWLTPLQVPKETLEKDASWCVKLSPSLWPLHSLSGAPCLSTGALIL